MKDNSERIKEFDTKVARIREYLQKNNLYGVYLKKRSNFAWITCGGDNRIVDASEIGWSGILVTKNSVSLITDNTEFPRIIDEEIKDLNMEKFEINWYKDELSNSIIKIGGSKNIASDIEIPNLKILDNSFERIQYQLTDPEIERFRELGKITSKSFTKIGKQVKRGMSELDVASMVSFELIKNNIQPHLILVAADNRISDYRHPIPTNNKINKYVMYVTVAVKWGLNLSITRFVHFGKISPEIKAKHDAIINIDARLILNTRPGEKLNKIFKEHINNFKKFGYPEEWKKLHQGGSASYRIRDVKPNLETPDKEIVLLNQAYAWNPSITGIKSEDTIIVHEDKNEIISEDTDWPLVEVKFNNKKILRPDILVKKFY